MLANNGSASDVFEPAYGSYIVDTFALAALHVSFTLNVLDSFFVELLLFTNCRSALFTGRLSKSVIIAALA